MNPDQLVMEPDSQFVGRVDLFFVPIVHVPAKGFRLVADLRPMDANVTISLPILARSLPNLPKHVAVEFL
jgi:hypothetical protein